MNNSERNLAKELYEVFEMLRDSDDFSESGTAKILKEKNRNYFLSRSEEEWKELTDEEHRHSDDFKQDFLLESSQFFYWLSLAAIFEKKSFLEFEKDFAKDLGKLEKLCVKNNIPLEEMFQKDLEECKEKGYLKN